MMKSGFLTQLDAVLKDDSDRVWIIKSPLKWWSKRLNRLITIPPWFETQETAFDGDSFFETDFSSVPRLPFIYELWGDREHKASALHDYLYRIDSVPVATFMQANFEFLDAMLSRLLIGPGVDTSGWKSLFKTPWLAWKTLLRTSWIVLKRKTRAYGIAYPMFWAVCVAGFGSYHKLFVKSKL